MKTFTFTTSNNLKALEHEQIFQACDKTLQDLAQRAGVPHVHTFAIKAMGIPSTKTKRPRIVMHVKAVLGLRCVYSQEVFSFSYENKHTLVLHNEPTSGDDDQEFIEHIHTESHAIDLKEIASQYVILGIPDYPQKDTLNTNAPLQSKETNKPFANLAHILEKKR